MVFGDCGLVIPVAHYGDMIPIWIVPLGGGTNERIEIVVILMLWPQISLSGSAVELSLHCAEGVARFYDDCISLHGLIVVKPQEISIAFWVIPMLVSYQQNPLFPVFSISNGDWDSYDVDV